MRCKIVVGGEGGSQHELRRMRVERGIAQSEAAAMVGIDPYVLNDCEHLRRPFSPEIEKALRSIYASTKKITHGC